MSPSKVKTAKTFLIVVPLAIGLLGFQNCAPANFQSMDVASKAETAFDEPAVIDQGEPLEQTEVGQPIVSNLPTEVPREDGGRPQSETPPVLSGLPKDSPPKKSPPKEIGPPQPDLLAPSNGQNLAANCKNLRADLKSSHVLPLSSSDVKTSGQAEVGPLLVHKVGAVKSTGGSALYLVGDNNESNAGMVDVKGHGHVVLCGLSAQMVNVVGNAVLDVVGANILNEPMVKGSGKVRIWTEAGEKL